MNQDNLIKLRQSFQFSILAELTIRNSILLEALLAQMPSPLTVTIQDGLPKTLAVLEGIASESEKSLRMSAAHDATRQMNADEFREIVETLKKIALDIAS